MTPCESVAVLAAIALVSLAFVAAIRRLSSGSTGDATAREALRTRIPELQRLIDAQDRRLREGEAAVETLAWDLAYQAHVIEQCEADRRALAAERDAERARADRLEAELAGLRRNTPVASYPGALD